MPSKKKASALESHVGFWLRFVSNHVSASFAALVEQHGVSVSEWVALRHMYNRDASAASELIAALGMTKGAVSKILTRLQDKGLVQRYIVDDDLRAQQLCLTEEGRTLVPKLAALADQNDEAFFGQLNDEQRNALLGTLKLLVRVNDLKQLPVL